MMMENILLSDKHILLILPHQQQQQEEGQGQGQGLEQQQVTVVAVNEEDEELRILKKNFCGKVITSIAELSGGIQQSSASPCSSPDPACNDRIVIYIAGDLSQAMEGIATLCAVAPMVSRCPLPILELCPIRGYVTPSTIPTTTTNNGVVLVMKEVDIGQVPVNIHNIGIYFRNFFINPNKEGEGNEGKSKSYFERIEQEHQFQDLTDSNKPTSAYRKGLYITEVLPPSLSVTPQASEHIAKEQHDGSPETKKAIIGPKFHLLRCSSNFQGPTDNFRSTDHEIIQQVNFWAERYFLSKTDLNHVLAQIYYNGSDNASLNANKKAKIKEHSDKTKDMPQNALMAFCTFYHHLNDAEGEESNASVNVGGDEHTNVNMKGNKKPQSAVHKRGYDYIHEPSHQSVLTRLRFRLKNDVIASPSSFVKQFDLVLYPNSVFLMSLSTNRLYTHEIVPSVLPPELIPTRMGYVIRCSNTQAIYDDKEGKTYIESGVVGEPTSYTMLNPTPAIEDIRQLKELYFQENISSCFINYSVLKNEFSLNKGDYMRPIL